MVQEFLGKAWPKFENTAWMPGTLLSTSLVVFGWSYFILTGSISQIWPMFGIANQLLASVALCVGTTVLLNTGKARYAWTTVLPLTFVSITTLYAGWRSIFDNFLPMAERDPSTAFTGYLDATATAALMACVVVILASSARAWTRALRGEPVSMIPATVGAPGDTQGPTGCC
jgi:carbon starvation protein